MSTLPSGSNLLKCRVQAFQFDAGVLGCEAPIGFGMGGISLGEPGADLCFKSRLIFDAPIEALLGQDSEFCFGSCAWACNAPRAPVRPPGPTLDFALRKAENVKSGSGRAWAAPYPARKSSRPRSPISRLFPEAAEARRDRRRKRARPRGKRHWQAQQDHCARPTDCHPGQAKREPDRRKYKRFDLLRSRIRLRLSGTTAMAIPWRVQRNLLRPGNAPISNG